MLPSFKLYYTVIVIRVVQYWNRNRFNEIEILEINLHMMTMNLWLQSHNHTMDNEKPLLQMCWETKTATCKKESQYITT